MLWPPDANSWLIWKDPDAGKDWEQEEKGMTEDEMAGWHHWLKRHEFESTPGVGDGQGGLACCSPWGHRVGYDWVIKQEQTPQRTCKSGSLAVAASPELGAEARLWGRHLLLDTMLDTQSRNLSQTQAPFSHCQKLFFFYSFQIIDFIF